MAQGRPASNQRQQRSKRGCSGRQPMAVVWRAESPDCSRLSYQAPAIALVIERRQNRLRDVIER
jgi:hypothetical protein